MKSQVIYLRTSTEDQNPENQLRECLTIVKGDYDLFQEKQSAFKDKDRPIFESIVAAIKKGTVKRLIIWDWDRLFRNRKKLKEFFELCKIYKCEVHSYRQKFFETFYDIPSPFDEIMQELFISLLGWMAEDESKKRSDRVKAAHKNSKKKWGRKPLDNIQERVLKLYKEGLSIRQISAQVTYWDKSRNKKNVSKSAVHKIIEEYKHKIS